MKIENLPYFHSIQQVFRLFVVDIMILVVFQLDLAHKFFIRCVIGFLVLQLYPLVNSFLYSFH